MSKSIHYRDEEAIKTFGNNVRKIRINKGLTIEGLANSIDMHVTQLARIERGETNPTLSYIVLLATVLDVEPCELLKKQ